jgi:hypothetical protein
MGQRGGRGGKVRSDTGHMVYEWFLVSPSSWFWPF